MSITVLLPFFAFCLVFVARLGTVPSAGEESRPWQVEYIISLSLWGAFLVAVTEGLGLIRAIERLPLGIAWGVLVLVLLVTQGPGGQLRRGWERVRSLFSMESLSERVLLGVVVALALVLVAVALAAPPNNIDTLQYHMPRVDHWAQNGSLQHFATTYDMQNARPYWTELVVLNVRVLWGGDRPGNLVQGFTLLAGMVAAGGIAGLLGGGRAVRWLAMIFTATTPVALLQVPVPKNDVTSAMWVVAAALFVILSLKRRLGRTELAAFGLSVGLAILTKGTAIIFVAVVLLWYSIAQIRRRQWTGLLRSGVVVATACVLLNSLFWYRNFVTYGGPYGGPVPINLPALSSSSVAADWAGPMAPVEGEAGPAAARTACLGDCAPILYAHGPSEGILSDLGGLVGEVAVRIARLLAMNFFSPFHAFNELYLRLLSSLPRVFPPDFVAHFQTVAWNNDTWAGNPLHLSLALASIAAAALPRVRRKIGGLAVGLALATIGGYVLLSASACDRAYCLRYQLPFFFLGAPVVALVIGGLGRRATWGSAFALVLYALPYVLISQYRPVIGHTPWPTRIPSVFTASPAEILFAQSPENLDEYAELTGNIREAGCSRVGLALQPLDQEYTLWWLLGAPESGIQVEHVVASAATEKLIDPRFSPCAILCTECGQVGSLPDLPLALDYGHIRLYMGSGESATP